MIVLPISCPPLNTSLRIYNLYSSQVPCGEANLTTSSMLFYEARRGRRFMKQAKYAST